MSLVLYNDLTRTKEPFVPLKEGHVGFYSCGPTVYDFFHIGNARPFIVFDVLRRYLEYSGYKVTFVQNFTDIEDKMINRANQEGITVKQLADRFIEEYFKDADALGIRRATHNPKATEHIPEIIALIEKLVEKGHAYAADGDVFFDVGSFPSYGVLAKQSLEELQSGARVEINERKRHPLDFSLWKAKKEGEPSWPSPWGEGRPGWHIECSAMSMKYLGETLDIHSGGTDLTFPHHENEVAQAEAATGKPFVRYWIHNGYLLIDKEKMSKSLGNFLTARAALQKYPAKAIRLFMLSAHYRSPINFSEESLNQSLGAVERLENCWSDLEHARKNRKTTSDGSRNEFESLFKEFEDRFVTAMDDDFNTAAALGVLFEAVKTVNTYLKETQTLEESFLELAAEFFRKIDSVLGVLGLDAAAGEEDAEEIEALIAERNAARKNKDFKRSDAIRDDLAARGILLEDTPDGTKWKKKA
ncbi:MAG TPA: cysteine--tRNA ligase [Synergistales bacterium]|nr:cysteine--tRNA ligase [Synergistaceae bacterium]HPE65745.1 cysteine--tRNA ligase [Synergistales bacterium]